MNLTAVVILFVCLAVCFIIRMPISFSMLISCIVYYLCTMPQALGIVAKHHQHQDVLQLHDAGRATIRLHGERAE